jgi:hypothetical protein
MLRREVPGHPPLTRSEPGIQAVGYRKVFRRDAGGQVVDFAERREAWDLVWVKAK